MKFGSSNKNMGSVELTPPSILAKSMTIVGDIACTGDIKIDGQVRGNINTNGRLIIGETGKIWGSVRATGIIVLGAFEGRLECAGTLSIRKLASVSGEIFYDKIEIDQGVELSGVLARLDVQKIQHSITEKSELLMRKKEDHSHLQVIKSGVEIMENAESNKRNKEDGGQYTIENTGWG
jgi:cytoskeletal protein CcmA (bactofilin family)